MTLIMSKHYKLFTFPAHSELSVAKKLIVIKFNYNNKNNNYNNNKNNNNNYINNNYNHYYNNYNNSL